MENQSNPTEETEKPQESAAKPIAKSAVAGTLSNLVLNTSATESTNLASSAVSPSSSLKSATAKTDEEKKNERAKRFGIPDKIQPEKKTEKSTVKSPTIMEKSVKNDNSSLGILKNESVVKFLTGFIIGYLIKKTGKIWDY